MTLLGPLGALLMGLVLGLIGGGGSILTVPLLVLLYHQDPLTATGLSLFIVGITSSAGAWAHQRQGNIHWPTAALFGTASVVSVFATRRWLVPALPDPLLTVGGHAIGKGDGLLLLFAVLMVLVAWTMIGRPPDLRTRHGDGGPLSRPVLLSVGVCVGALTGLLGAGGGFLIIPALVLFAGLDMRHAVGTSLVLIAVNAFIGFIGDTHVHLGEHVALLVPFVSLAIVGILVGSRLASRVPAHRLRPAFGWSVLAMGVYLLARHWA